MKLKFAAAFLFLCPSLALAEPINIALVGPMTGPLAAFGDQMKHGAELAIADLNTQGGLNGRQINLIVEDDACDPKQATEVANRIVSRGIKYVIGHWCASTTMAVEPIYADEGALHIDPAGLIPEESAQGIKTFFRISSQADYWGKVAADYAITHDKPKRVLIAMDSRAATKVFGTAIAAELKKKDPSIQIIEETYEAGAKDFSAIITKAKNFKTDVIFAASYTMEGALIVRQAQAVDAAKRYYGFDTLGSPDFAKTVGMEKADQIIYIDYARPQSSPLLDKFNQRLDAQGWPRETYSYIIYGTFQLLDQAFKLAQSDKPTDLAEKMRAGRFNTILGDIWFSPQGDNQNIRFAAYRWHDNKVEAIGPAN